MDSYWLHAPCNKLGRLTPTTKRAPSKKEATTILDVSCVPNVFCREEQAKCSATHQDLFPSALSWGNFHLQRHAPNAGGQPWWRSEARILARHGPYRLSQPPHLERENVATANQSSTAATTSSR